MTTEKARIEYLCGVEKMIDKLVKFFSGEIIYVLCREMKGQEKKKPKQINKTTLFHTFAYLKDFHLCHAMLMYTHKKVNIIRPNELIFFFFFRFRRILSKAKVNNVPNFTSPFCLRFLDFSVHFFVAGVDTNFMPFR